MSATVTQLDANTQLGALGDLAVAWLPAGLVLRLEQCIADVFGEIATEDLKMSVARDTSRDLIAAVGTQRGVAAGVARFALSRQLFASLGEGRFVLETAGERRVATATALFGDDGTSSRSGYAAGWIAASLELALTRPPNTILARQRAERSGPQAAFDFQRDEGAAGRRASRLADMQLGADPGGDADGVHRALLARAATLVDAHAPDAQGVREFMGKTWCARPAAYFARLVDVSMTELEKSGPEVADALHGLLVESTSRAVVEALVAIALSDEWELYCGSRPQLPSQLAAAVCAIAGALGWGRIVPESVSGDAVVLRSGVLFDDPALGGDASGPTERRFVLEGMAAGIARAVEQLDLGSEDAPHPHELTAIGRRGRVVTTRVRARSSGDSCDMVRAEPV